MPTNKTEETCPKGREYRKTYLNLTKAIEKEDETYKHYSREYRIHKYAPDAVKAKAAEESAKSFRQIRQEVKVKAARNGVALPTITSKSLGRMAYFGSMGWRRDASCDQQNTQGMVWLRPENGRCRSQRIRGRAQVLLQLYPCL